MISGRNFKKEIRTGTWALPALLLAVVLVLTVGPMKGLVAIVGLIVVFYFLVHPLATTAFLILSNTSLQVLGSSHLTGLPTSLSKLSGVIGIGMLLIHVWGARWKLTASPFYRPLLFFAILVLSWDFLIRNPETGVMEGTIRLTMMIVMATIVATVGGQKFEDLDKVVIIMISAIALCGVIGVAEHFLPTLAVESDDPRLAQGAIGAVLDRESLDGTVIKRITGGIGDANWLSYTIAICIPLIFYGWHRFEGQWARTFLMMAAGLQMIALVFSYTRTGFLGLGIAFLYLAVRRVVPLRPMLAALFLGTVAVTVYLPPGLVDRMFSSKYLKEGSTPIRRLFFDHAAEIWLEKPLLGYGYKGFGINFYDRVLETLPDDIRLIAWAADMEKSVIEGRELVSNIGAHNLQLELLIEYGLVGAFLYFSLFFVAFVECRRMEIRGPPHLRILGICMTASLIAFLVCGLLGHAKYLKFVWIVFGLVMAAGRLSRVGESDAVPLLHRRRD